MISVAMTTYNGAQYVSEQLASILNQTVPVDEIIIFDDVSTDETAQILEEFDDSRIFFRVNPSNLGYIQNFYNAIKACSGDYIFLADQDDIWESDKVEKMLEVMKADDYQALCSNFSLIDGQGNLITDTGQFVTNRFFERIANDHSRIIDVSFDYLMKGNIVQGATYCITKKTQEAYIALNNQTVYHDHQLLLIAAQIGKVAFLNEKLIHYRIHGNNTIGISTKKNLVWLKKLKFPKLEPSMVTFLKQLNQVSKVDHYWYYVFYYYLRIPSIKNILRTLK